MRAPAVAARRAVSCAARAARACGQLGAAASGVAGGAGTVRPASASLAAQAGPACAIRTASRARVAWVTVTVTKPGPVTSAVRDPRLVAELSGQAGGGDCRDRGLGGTAGRWCSCPGSGPAGAAGHRRWSLGAGRPASLPRRGCRWPRRGSAAQLGGDHLGPAHDREDF